MSLNSSWVFGCQSGMNPKRISKSPHIESVRNQWWEKDNTLTEMASVRSWREARVVEMRWYSVSVSSNTVCHCCKNEMEFHLTTLSTYFRFVNI